MRVHVCYVYQTVCVSACVPEFASVTKWLWTCMPVSVHISVCVCMCMCVVCFNMSTTCGNLIIWNWNMCSCLCLSSLAPPLSFSSFLLLSLLDNSNKFGRSGYTPWYNMPASPFPPLFSLIWSSFSCPFHITALSQQQTVSHEHEETHAQQTHTDTDGEWDRLHAHVCLCRPLRLLTFSIFAHIK